MPSQLLMDTDNNDEETRGTKRKATEDLPTPAPRRIKALDPDVVNKIAAGEIIVAPVHALKELIENAVDAGSTQLEIVVKEGGLKLLQITDNGHGINKDDMGILCERFTTSKLKTFEDLQSIETYGFRGEALASISHIAHLTVTTKTNDSDCAWRAQYAAGKLIPPKPGQSAEPRPVAGKQGTQITVEDLFYNVPSRRRAFRSPNDEYSKILDVVGRYAVHCEGVAFSCKKYGEANMGITTQAAAKTADRIRQIHGNSVANELISFTAEDDKLGFKAQGIACNANYSVKKTTLLLFINHRSVESSAIKKAFESTYQPLLPKGGRPFVYLSLEINPRHVDVNVHPTKREVNFLYEDEIIEKICTAAQEKLASVDTSRSFMTQTLLPNRPILTAPITPSASTSKKPYESSMVRTDARERKITTMLQQSRNEDSPSNNKGLSSSSDTYETVDKDRVLIKLTSIKTLRAEVRENTHAALTEVFANHTYVGVVDEKKRIAAIQSGVKLYLVDYGAISCEFFYQLGLTDFGNFGTIRFEQPLSLVDLLDIGIEDEKIADEQDVEDAAMSGTPMQTQSASFWDNVVMKVANQLIDRRAMLLEYFSLEISEEGELLSIPLLLKGYTPSMTKLPSFLLRLGPHVNWTSEVECFQTFLRELAIFHVPEPLPTRDDENGQDEEVVTRRKEMTACLESVIFPAFKRRILAEKKLLANVTEVANLKGLYRIFERSC